ncbi:MAG: hypothetical protein Q9207_002445 [Kuettlingeria erythrocarpa]
MGNHCQSLESPNRWNFALSLYGLCFILVGILVSYLPQHYRIVARRSSEGISPYFVLLGTTSGTFAFANILTLPESRADLACCSEITLVVVAICLGHLFVTVIIHLVVVYRSPQSLRTCAQFFGIAGTLLAAIQFLPQIYTTWKLQAVGSLSIPMMCIQTPGSFVWVGSLAGRLGLAGWSTWGIYLMTGLLQGGLLIMAICFEIRDRRDQRKSTILKGAAIDGQEEDNDGAARGVTIQNNDENTALLGNER